MGCEMGIACWPGGNLWPVDREDVEAASVLFNHHEYKNPGEASGFFSTIILVLLHG